MVTLGLLKVTLRFLFLSKRKANTIELHPKVIVINTNSVKTREVEIQSDKKDASNDDITIRMTT